MGSSSGWLVRGVAGFAVRPTMCPPRPLIRTAYQGEGGGSYHDGAVVGGRCNVLRLLVEGNGVDAARVKIEAAHLRSPQRVQGSLDVDVRGNTCASVHLRVQHSMLAPGVCRPVRRSARALPPPPTPPRTPGPSDPRPTSLPE